MNLPPSVLRVRVTEGGRRKVRLWIPLFLVWPLAIVTLALLAPAWFAVCLLCRKARRFAFAGPLVLGACWAARGLRVDVKDAEEEVFVSLR